MVAEFDHVVIHVDDRDACTAFYVAVLNAWVVDNPEGAHNPLGSIAYRIGSQQINVHGPWPGMTVPCCPEPHNLVGGADLAFRTERTSAENTGVLASLGVDIVEGPVKRFGSRCWGLSVYCHDPSGNGIELISYEDLQPA